MLKEKYEISLWEDYLVPVTKESPEHYDERKLAIIGSDTMTAQWRALEPRLVENINGTNTFTFKMYYTYIDNETGEKVQNPVSKLMVNERKVKVFWKNKWYDLVIKSIQEDSNGKSYTYTCKDLFINELSKTGFNLEFDEKLGNNLGTVVELGERVIEGTDWKIDSDNSDIIEQLTEEAVFEVSGVDLTVPYTQGENQTGKEIILDKAIISLELNKPESDSTKWFWQLSNQKLLVFYSTVINQNPLFQFLYSETGKFPTEENEMLVVNTPVYSIEGAQWLKNENVYTVTINGATIKFNIAEKVSTRYRAKRPVRQQKQVYDPTIKEYVYVYNQKDGNGGLVKDDAEKIKEFYGVEHTEFNSPIVVVNLLANYSNFSDTEGWLTKADGGTITFWQLPNINTSNWSDYKGISYLKLDKAGSYLNRGIKLNTQYLPDGFMPGEKYIVRIKAFDILDNPQDGKIFNDGIIIPSIGEYDEKSYDIKTSYFTSSLIKNDEWLEYELTCKKALSRSDLLTIFNFGLVFKISKPLYIQEVQLFKEVIDSNGTRINPGEIEKQGIIKTVYIYYDPDKNTNATSWEDLIAEQKTYEKSSIYKPVYNTSNDGKEEKIRSITAKNSNRFNLIQSLAETFECWVRFNIEHDIDGSIKLENGIPKKTITFKAEIGQETGVGFVYGIDLKQISRTIDSDKITSKVIVQPNINELAEDGICTIASSTENYPRTSFVLNFDYYINHGLLDGNALIKDLYLSTPDSIGYYFHLNRLNTESQLKAKTLAEQKKVQLEQESMLKTYSEALTATQEQKNQLKNDVIQLANTKWEDIGRFIEKNPNYTDLISKVEAEKRVEVNEANYQKLVDSLSKAKENLDSSVNTLSARQDEIVEEIKALDKKFYEKYSRYIQEGSWTSQDYIDPNYYYLDAQSVAYTSSRPQVTYNISVLRLGSLEEYKNKVFHLGDISFIEDVEFFGYLPQFENTTNKTPYREKVLVSEVTSNFDSPENDSFKVQNYKTQFEDLFQRINATTQALSYASGEYQRAANIVEADGTINSLTLANSIAINQNLVISAQNETFIQDNTGITLIDSTNPNNKVKLTSKGIILTKDGGLTWKDAVTSSGIRTQFLTAGAINTDYISIGPASKPNFRWSSEGLDAYYYGESGINHGKFVRFDQYGIYGMINNDSDIEKIWIPNGEDQIWNEANFGMTWRGFFVKNKGANGWVEVSSENDVAVFKTTEIEKIKIGRIGETKDGEIIYGIKIADDNGNSVLITRDDGTLWLENKLSIETYNENNSVQIGKLDEKEYIEIDLTESKVFEEDEIYYKLDENGNYILVSETIPDEDTTYYTLNIDRYGGKIINANNKFIVYEDGTIEATQGIFAGELSAATGSFSGTLEAASGSFSGNINATSGNIGNVEISSTGDLRVINSGLSIIKQEYESLGQLDSFESGQTYYKKVNEEYVLVSDTLPEENTEYFIFKETPLLFYNEEDQVLEIAGDSIFSGNIGALSGTFTGEIQAQSGKIGGFIINSGSLVSEAENEPGMPSIILNGELGQIEANNIILGTSATIKEYIQMGNSYIYNPNAKDENTNTSSNKFISVKDDSGSELISLTNNGDLKVGNIEIIGSTSEMSIGEISFNGISSIIKGKNFNITPELASFNQIAITNGIFKTGEIQSLGGAMLFKPVASCKIEGTKIIEIDGAEVNERNNWVITDGSWVILSKFNQESTNPMRLSWDETTESFNIISNEDLSDYDTITYYCTIDNNGNIRDNLIIGVNSGNSSISIDNSEILVPKAISFKEIQLKEIQQEGQQEKEYYPVLNETPSLVIGDLSSVDYEGYGLYGENVFLNGTLTTKIGNDSYAGVNTISGVLATKFGEYGIKSNNGQIDESRIVFWGGANSTSDVDIQNANFQVTEQGSIYANQGVFEGTLITKSTIEGSVLRAAKIYGWTIEENEESGLLRDAAALQIYNTNENLGIQFREEVSEKDYLTMSLSTNGFRVFSRAKQEKNEFISFTIKDEDSTVNANLNEINFNILSSEVLRIEDTKIGKYSQISESSDSSYKAFISFEETFGHLGIGNTDIITYSSSSVTNTQDFQTQKNVIFGTNEGKMSYQQQIDTKGKIKGYDLYIS